MYKFVLNKQVFKIKEKYDKNNKEEVERIIKELKEKEEKMTFEKRIKQIRKAVPTTIDFEYEKNGRKPKGLKPRKEIIEKAFNHFIDGFEKERKSYYFVKQRTYTYTEVVNEEVISFLFVYKVDRRNSLTGNIKFVGNWFDFISSYNYKTKEGYLNENYRYSLFGWHFKEKYHSMMISYINESNGISDDPSYMYDYDRYKEDAESYKKIKINEFLTIDTKGLFKKQTQRLMTLDEKKLEYLYKMGFENLFTSKLSNKKMLFVKEHRKKLNKNITKTELDQKQRIIETGIPWNRLAEAENFISRHNGFSKMSYVLDKQSERNYNYGETKIITKENIENLKRALDLEKNFGNGYVRHLAGSCYYSDVDFIKTLNKTNPERKAVIEIFEERTKEIKAEERLRRRLWEKRKQKEIQDNLITVEQFSKDHVIYKNKLEDGSYFVERVDDIEIEKYFNKDLFGIKGIYEEKKEFKDFLSNNFVELRKNKEKTDVYINFELIKKESRNSYFGIEIMIEYNKMKSDRKMKKGMESVTKKYKVFENDKFVFEPIRTYKDFERISEEMNNCLVRNEFHKKVYEEKSVIYLCTPKEETIEKAEVIEWSIDKNKTIKVSQIHGKDNSNTNNYKEIKKIAENKEYKDLLEEGTPWN